LSHRHVQRKSQSRRARLRPLEAHGGPDQGDRGALDHEADGGAVVPKPPAPAPTPFLRRFHRPSRGPV